MGSIALQIRPGDCDSFGHVNNAAYVALIEYALVELLAALDGIEPHKGGRFHWALEDMAIEYRQAATNCDDLRATVWLVKPHRERPVTGCEISRFQGMVGEAEPVVRARIGWRIEERETGQPIPLPEGLLHAFPSGDGVLPRPFKIPADSPEFRRYHWNHQVMRTEVDPGNLAHPQAIYNWIEEAIFEASAKAGWPMTRWLAENLIVFQMRHDTTFKARPMGGDLVRITSRLAEVRRRRGTWINEIFRQEDGALLVRNYSTGVFLNREGRSAVPPAGMMDSIQFGE